jgi:hypothetical protein
MNKSWKIIVSEIFRRNCVVSDHVFHVVVKWETSTQPEADSPADLLGLNADRLAAFIAIGKLMFGIRLIHLVICLASTLIALPHS